MNKEGKNKKLGILVYNQVQPMDVIGPWEVLSTWKNILAAPLDMYLVSEMGGEIECVNQISLKSHCSFDDSPHFDYLIVPGGSGRREQMKNKNLLHYLNKQAENCEYLLAICTGAFLLHAAGLLANQQATTYWRAIPELKALDGIQLSEKRIVKSGKIWTTGGISSGIDLAFEFTAAIAGLEAAGKVQLLFEYFPEDTIYCSEKMVENLPDYAVDKALVQKLPQYIQDYIKVQK